MKAAAPMCLLALLATSARAQDFGPWSADPRHPVMSTTTTARPARAKLPSSSPFILAYDLWSKLLTRIDGPRCMHRPTCSSYAIQAMSRSPLTGFYKALSRLMRGPRSSALRMLPLVRLPEGVFYLDPL